MGITEGKSVRGGTAGDRLCGGILKGGSPGGLGGVPADPGLRRVPGLPGFPAFGASGRVAAAPPSPSESSAATGPNHRSRRGEAASYRSRCPLEFPRRLGRTVARPMCRAAGRPSTEISRTPASETAGSEPHTQNETPSSLQLGTVRRASGAWAHQKGRAQGTGWSTRRYGGGSWPGPLNGEGGREGEAFGTGPRRGETPNPPRAQILSPHPKLASSPVNCVEAD